MISYWKETVVAASKLALVLAGLLVCSRLHAQSEAPPLERVITVTFNNEKLDDALRKLSQRGVFVFSYNPSIFDASRLVNGAYMNKTVREILNDIFQGTIQYKERGRYVILTRADVRAAAPKDAVKLSGYIIDESTGQRLSDVSVYDPVTLSSAVTDKYGYFEIEIDKPTANDIILAVNKLNYADTVVALPAEGNFFLNIPIKESTDKIATVADSVAQKIKRFWRGLIKRERDANIRNIQDTLYRKVQMSLVPFVGTNHKLSGNVVNNYSLNLLGGYSQGTRKLEIGGLFNIDRGRVHGVQVGGVFNGAGETVKGVQIGGLVNANLDSMKGGQFAGLVNMNWRSATGFTGAGAINFIHGDSRGVSMAGLGNFTLGAQRGPHFGGVFNFATKDVKIAQAAGVLNFALGETRGAQLGGALNIAIDDIRGAQVAGALNVATGTVRGAQVSGVMNYATRVKGVQLGLVNIADSVRGMQLGFFSFAMKGYHALEVSAEDIFYLNLAFRTGTRSFYNIFTTGLRPNESDSSVWSFGYGVGTAPRVYRKLYLNIDVTANQIVKGNDVEALNMLNKLYLGFDYQVSKFFAITAGATLNVYITENDYHKYPDIFVDYTPDFFQERLTDNHLAQLWWGAKVGVRFF